MGKEKERREGNWGKTKIRKRGKEGSLPREKESEEGEKYPMQFNLSGQPKTGRSKSSILNRQQGAIKI